MRWFPVGFIYKGPGKAEGEFAIFDEFTFANLTSFNRMAQLPSSTQVGYRRELSYLNR